MVGETLRHALDSLAVVAPDWLLVHFQSTWVDLYGSQVQNYRLPTSQEKRDALADQIGADRLILLNAIWQAESPIWLREAPAVPTCTGFGSKILRGGMKINCVGARQMNYRHTPFQFAPLSMIKSISVLSARLAGWVTKSI